MNDSLQAMWNIGLTMKKNAQAKKTPNGTRGKCTAKRTNYIFGNIEIHFPYIHQWFRKNLHLRLRPRHHRKLQTRSPSFQEILKNEAEVARYNTVVL